MAARRRHERFARFAAAGVLAVVAIASLASARRANLDAPGESGGWPVGVAQPIAVVAGKARFVAPSGSTSARTLVIVSALAKNPGRYPIRITARPARQAEPPALAGDGPATQPSVLPKIHITPPTPPKSTAPGTRTFYLPVRDGDPSSASNYVAVLAHLRGSSAGVAVYVDPADIGRVDDAMVRDVVKTLDERILPVARRTIGTADDVDGDGRFAVLFSGWLGQLADGKLAVDGYVRGADFEPAQAPPLGNRCDVMYLNSALKSGPHLRTVMAHEYTHAVTYCRKALGPSKVDEEGWLDESLAHLAEDLHGFSRSNLDYRVAAYLAEPDRYRLLVRDFGAAGLIRSHGHRGGAYLFVRWCADRYGPDLLGQLVRSDRAGVANLEAATGQTFAALFRGWSASLFLDAMKPDDDDECLTPRASRIVIDGPEDRAVLDATTSHFAIVEGTRDGAVAVEVEGPRDAEIQVTAIPLPRDYPRIDLDVGIEHGAGGRPGLVARIRERDGRLVAIQTLSCESSEASPGSPRRLVLKSAELRSILGRDSLAGRDRVVSRPIPLDDDAGRIITLVGRDERGRKVVARAEIGPRPGF